MQVNLRTIMSMATCMMSMRISSKVPVLFGFFQLCKKCDVSCDQHDVTVVANEGSLWGLSHEDPHDDIHNLVDVCGPFSFKNITQESVWFCWVTFSLMGKQQSGWMSYQGNLSLLGSSYGSLLWEIFPFLENG